MNFTYFNELNFITNSFSEQYFSFFQKVPIAPLPARERKKQKAKSFDLAFDFFILVGVL